MKLLPLMALSSAHAQMDPFMSELSSSELLSVFIRDMTFKSQEMLGSNGERRDKTLSKLLPYLMISGTPEDDMPDMGLIAEAIMDPEGQGASSFFTEMSMKNILGEELGGVMGVTQEERPEKMQEYVLSMMGIEDTVIPLLLADPATLTGADKLNIFSWLNKGRSISPNVIRLLLGQGNDDIDVKEMYLESLIAGGSVDEMTGTLISALMSGQPRSTLIDIFFRASRGMLKPDHFEPDLSILPKGIYPGQKMFYVHVESIGLDSCLLVSPINRYKCGAQFGSDITEDQCNAIPYCCYNEIDISDDEAQMILGKPDASADSIPSCYYNVFFVFYDQFSLEVQPLTKFPQPADCLPLFRFGFDLQPEVWEYFLMTDKTKILVNDRTQCGFPGITKFHCVAIRGCCFDEESGAGPECFWPVGQEPDVYNPGNADGTTNEVDYQDAFQLIRSGNGDCNNNYYKIPELYEERLACNMPLEHFIYANRDPLLEPTRSECLSIGCCWEEDDSVIEDFPMLPRCYRVENGGNMKNRPNLDDLVMRSADLTIV